MEDGVVIQPAEECGNVKLKGDVIVEGDLHVMGNLRVDGTINGAIIGRVVTGGVPEEKPQKPD